MRAQQPLLRLARDGGPGRLVAENVLAVVSAVISGAAGAYVLKLMADAAVGTDLTVQPGQTVVVSGDQGLAAAPAWGAGGFSVQQSGSLSLEYVRLDAVSSAFGSVSSSVGLPSLPDACPPFAPFRPTVIRRPLNPLPFDALCVRRRARRSQSRAAARSRWPGSHSRMQFLAWRWPDSPVPAAGLSLRL